MHKTKFFVAASGALALGWAGLTLGAPETAGVAVPPNPQPEATKATRKPTNDLRNGFSYDFFQMGYIVNSNLEDPAGGDVDGNGLDLQVSKSIGDYFFVSAASITPDYRLDTFDQTFGDWVLAGPGVHVPLISGNHALDIWGQVSYDRIGFQGLAATGYGLAAGLRFAATPLLELDASVRYADTQADIGGTSIDVTPLIYDLAALYYVSPRLALTAGYRGGQIQLESGGSDQNLDLNQFTVGLRYLYGVESDTLPDLPSDPPTSYNYAQVSYVVAGEASADGGDIDTNGGLALEASALFSDYLFVRGTVRTFDYDIDSPNSDLVLSDMASIGPGLRYGHALGPVHLDVYGQVTYERLAVGPFVADGVGGEVGTRALLVPGVELSAWYRYAYTQFNDDSSEAEPQFYGLRLLLSVPNQQQWSNLALVIDYMDGQVDLNQSALGVNELDVSALSVGLRANF